MKRALLIVFLAGAPVTAQQSPQDYDVACPNEGDICTIKKAVLRDLIHARAPRPGWNRES